MNKIAKKILTFAAATMMATTTAFAASAGYGHSTDKFDYGMTRFLLASGQYSNFYCEVQKHTATAIVKRNGSGGFTDKDKKEAKKGKWAKAETQKYLYYDEYNSYYDHPGGVK